MDSHAKKSNIGSQKIASTNSFFQKFRYSNNDLFEKQTFK
jgi:hypothetical protein